MIKHAIAYLLPSEIKIFILSYTRASTTGILVISPPAAWSYSVTGRDGRSGVLYAAPRNWGSNLQLLKPFGPRDSQNYMTKAKISVVVQKACFVLSVFGRHGHAVHKA